MKSKTVGFSESQEYINEIGLKRWRKIWHEVEVEAGDDATVAYKYAEEMVNKWGMGQTAVFELNPTLQKTFQSITVKDLQSEKVEAAIDNATSLQELDLLMGDAAKYGLAAQLNAKKKQLSQLK